MTKDSFHYDPNTDPQRPIMEEIKNENFPFKIKCDNKGKALHTSQRLYKIFRWYKEQFKNINEIPPEFPELTIREDKRGNKWYVYIKAKSNLGIMVTKEGEEVEIKSGKQNWNFDTVREVENG